MNLTVLDLFSGIGGFSLGLRMAGGFETVQFVEIDPYCQKVLAKNFPGVPIHGDIRTFRGERGCADVICGGFPCQDISLAGKGAGLDGERSGLWREFYRIIGEVRPRYVVVENVAALLGRGLGRVLGDLAEIGYDVEWHCIPASAVGASHRRDRLWAVAYSNGDRPQGIGEGSVTCFTNGPRKGSSSGGALAKTTPPDPDSSRVAPSGDDWGMGWGHVFTKYRPWEIASQPFIRRGIDGVPNRLDRLRGLGNAVVPQVVAEIGKAILQAERIAA